MDYYLATTCLNDPGPLSFGRETFSIFLGDIAAVSVAALAGLLFFYIVKYPGFRVGAGWSWTTTKPKGKLQVWPNVSVTSYDPNVEKIIATIWVRERADIDNPGAILGKLDLRQTGQPTEDRTTGGDVLNLRGPVIECEQGRADEVMKFPIFVQTSDGHFYKALSPGHPGSRTLQLRMKMQRVVYNLKEGLQKWLG